MADYTRNLPADAVNLTTVDNNAKAEQGAGPPMVQVALFSDEFGEALDAHWTEGTLGLYVQSGSAAESGGKVRLTWLNGDASSKGDGIYTPAVFNNVIAEVEIDNFPAAFGITNLSSFGLWIVKDTNNWAHLYYYCLDTATYALGCQKKVGGVVAGLASVAPGYVPNFKLRITRAGDTYTFEYDIGAGWVSFGNFDFVIGADCNILLLHRGRYLTTKYCDVLYCRITGSGYYWDDSPEADIVDSATIGVGESYAFDAGAGGQWSLTGASSVEDGDGGTNRWKVGYSDNPDGTGVTWDVGWLAIADVNINAAAGNYNGHRYLYVKWQGNSDGTQFVNATSFTVSGTTVLPTHTWTQDATQHKEGAYSFKQVGPAVQNDDYYAQEIDVVPGEIYHLSVYGKCTVAPTTGFFYLQAFGVGDVAILTSKLNAQTTDFVKFEFSFVVPTGVSEVEVRIGGNVQGGTIYWDAADCTRERAKGYV